MDYEVELQEKIWSEVIEKDSQTQQTCKEDAVDRRKWKSWLKMLYSRQSQDVSELSLFELRDEVTHMRAEWLW